MSTKRGLLIVVIASVVSLVGGSGAIYARVPAPALTSGFEPPYRDADQPSRLEGDAFASTGFSRPPTVGPDIPIYEEDNEQWTPSIAYNWKHDEYLVVWHNVWGGGGRDIYARRISGQGEILSWFAVTAGPHDRAYPSVAYDPDHDRYLVVWMYDFFGDGSNWDIVGRFIPWDGPDASLTDFSICTWNSNQRVPAVVYNENPAWSEFLVVWSNTPSSVPAYISARRVFADGSGFPPGNGFTVDSDMTDDYFNPDVAYNLARNEYLVVYSRNAVDIRATRLQTNGNILGGGPINVTVWPDQERLPAVAACHTSDQYFVVWQSLQNSTHFDIYGRFVEGDGAVASVHHLAFRPIHEASPDIVSDPGAHHYLIVWQEQYSNLSGPYGVSGRLIETDATMGNDFVIVAPYAGVERTEPAVAAGPPGYLVAWEHDRYGTSYTDIHGRLVWPAVVYLPLTVRNCIP